MTIDHPDRIDLARRAAGILGPSSAAAAAVRRYDEIRVAGYPSKIIRTKTMWLVEEPMPETAGIAGHGSAFRRDESESDDVLDGGVGDG